MSLEETLKKGDVISFRARTLIGKTIGLFTNSDFSHTAAYIGNGKYVHSNQKGVHLSPVSELNIEDIVVLRHKKARNKQLNKAIDWMVGEVGKKYDFLGLVGIGLHILGLKKGNPWDHKNRYWCSELVADGYLNAGIYLPIPDTTWKVSPEDFMQMEHFETVYDGRC